MPNPANGLVGINLVFADHFGLDTFYSRSSVNDLLSITENSSIDANKKMITNFIKKVPGASYDREEACLMNIIDINISPINPHALLREIPLINVYNYAFTFDDIVKKEVFNIDVETYNDTIDSSNKAFAALLLDPYYSVNKRVPSANAAGTPGVNASVGFVDNTNALQLFANIHYKNTNTVFKHMLTNDIPSNGQVPFRLGHPRYVKEIATKFQDAEDSADLRLNNKFTRNLLFLTNLQRFLLYKVKREVEHVNSKKISSNNIVNSRIVSYDNGNEQNNEDEFSYLMV
jgi:hypothetical protein